jgi:hypothetical protein
MALIDWANLYLPSSLQITETAGQVASGLQIMRLAEAIKGNSASPPVLDSAFPSGPEDEELEGLVRLFDFLLDSGVRFKSVTVNDVRYGRKDKILQLLQALRAWDEKRHQVRRVLNGSSEAIA